MWFPAYINVDDTLLIMEEVELLQLYVVFPMLPLLGVFDTSNVKLD